MFIIAWADEAFLHACTHAITWRVTTNSVKTVMASAAAPLEHQIDIIGARFGYQLQGKQKEAIIAYTSGKDTFVALPTGYGKSLIYGCLPLVFDSVRGLVPGTSLALVVCPLKALMKDQTERFRQLGITAAYAGEPQVSMERFARGDFQLIFISPEWTKNESRLVARPQQRQRSSRTAIAKNVGGVRCNHSECNFIRSPNFGSNDTSYY